MISVIWSILREDTQGRKLHFVPFPEDLVKTPIVLNCPPGELVSDPFVGTGTNCVAAAKMNRSSVGIDITPEYLEIFGCDVDSDGTAIHLRSRYAVSSGAHKGIRNEFARRTVQHNWGLHQILGEWYEVQFPPLGVLPKD